MLDMNFCRRWDREVLHETGDLFAHKTLGDLWTVKRLDHSVAGRGGHGGPRSSQRGGGGRCIGLAKALLASKRRRRTFSDQGPGQPQRDSGEWAGREGAVVAARRRDRGRRLGFFVFGGI